MNKITLFAVTVLLLSIAGVRGDDPTPRKPELPVNSWVNLKPSGIRPSLPGWETLHYCPVSEQAVVWADYKTFTTECQHSLLGYDGKVNRWHVLNASPYHETDLTPTCDCMCGFGFATVRSRQRQFGNNGSEGSALI